MDGGAWWARVHGSQRVGHDWKTSLSKDHLKVECQLCCKTILIVVKWSLIDRPHLDWEELQRSTTHSRWGHPMQTHDLGFPKNDDCYVQTWFFNCPWKQCPWDKMKYLNQTINLAEGWNMSKECDLTWSWIRVGTTFHGVSKSWMWLSDWTAKTKVQQRDIFWKYAYN